MKRYNRLVLLTLLLSVVSLFIEQARPDLPLIRLIVTVLDFVILGFLVLDVVLSYAEAKFKFIYFKRNIYSLLFFALFLILFVYNKIIFFTTPGFEYYDYSVSIIILRNLFILLKLFSRLRRITSFLENIRIHPAQTILLSFLAVIVTGAIFLTMPFATKNGEGLSILNALFTSTSAVCVTGLIVVDTATVFTLWGKIIVLSLVQIGGLGIMILSYFTVYSLGRSASVKDKFLLSYMLSEGDMRNVVKSLRNIIYITAIVEGIGALLLYFRLRGISGTIRGDIGLAVFHSISAFCNAGFSLFSDSFESFVTDWQLNMILCFLIIIGGLGFAVISNLRSIFAGRLSGWITSLKADPFKARQVHDNVPVKKRKLTQNSKIVLLLTAALLIVGMFLFYALEHNGTLKGLGTGTQYLASFFQSVTLRTAGFNTVPIGNIAAPALLFMMVFMFIGAGSGSTGGGIKINSVAAIGSYLFSVQRNRNSVVLLQKSIPREKVLRAFLILLFGITVVASGTFVLSLTENAGLKDLLFEAVSAFGTVGLSTGVTFSLSGIGKMVIIILMFMGRLGPLTLLAATSARTNRTRIEYPEGDIAIG
jgi:trk system potassium uptake protein